MYDNFKWTKGSARRNRLTAEYEPLQPFLMTALAERAACQTFIDVGANIGTYSLFATLIHTVRNVIAFEADPTTYAELERNVLLNGLESRVQVQPNAVSSAVGSLTFGSVGQFSGANSVVATSIHDESSFRDQYTVNATTLDEAITKDSPGPLAIKIDVEGHELLVLEGSKALLCERPVLIQIECYGSVGDLITARLDELGLGQLTAIGPDRYFTNIASLRDPVEIVKAYERASSALITNNHRGSPLIVERGDFKLEVTGRSAELVRRFKRSLRRHRRI